MKAQYTEPTSMDEAEARRAVLVREIQDIQADLAQKNRTDEHGRRVTGKEYHEWRAKAVYAMTCRQQEQQQIRAWIHRHKMQPPVDREARNRVISLAYGLLVKAVSAGSIAAGFADEEYLALYYLRLAEQKLRRDDNG